MSNSGQPDLQALDELETVTRSLGEELARWRKRALTAEGGGGEASGGARVAVLESENAELAKRLDAAGGRVRQLLERLRFLEEQVATEEAR